LSNELSDIISEAFAARTDSDYSDFFEMQEDEACALVQNAKHFFDATKEYLDKK
jgi:uncharacterized protein (UPF0332 family)